MLEFQEKRKLKRFLYSKITLVVLLVFILILLNAIWNMYKKQNLTKDNLAKTAGGLDDLRAREKMLSSEIDRLKTQSGTEAEIREKYGLVKPGEEVIVVVGNASNSSESGSDSAGRSFWQKVWDWLK